MAKTRRSKGMPPFKGDVNMNEDLPVVGQKVYFIDNRETQGILNAIVTLVDSDGNVDLLVYDMNASGGSFIVMSSQHDEDCTPGTWHYPK